MYISKRGPQFVLVATLLVMLLPRLCKTMPANDELSSSRVRLYVPQRGSVSDRVVAVYRNGTVSASSQKPDDNDSLVFKTNGSENEPQELYINIYSTKAKRYICFNRAGKVKLVKTLRRLSGNRGRHRRLICRFLEQLVRGSPQRGHRLRLYKYVADERHRSRKNKNKKRVISFCRGRGVALMRPIGRRSRRRCGALRNSRRRNSSRRRSRRPYRKRHNRCLCQYAFMKKEVPW